MATTQIITPDHLRTPRVEVTLIMSNGRTETSTYAAHTVGEAVVESSKEWDEAYAREWGLSVWVYAILVDGKVIFVRQ